MLSAPRSDSWHFLDKHVYIHSRFAKSGYEKYQKNHATKALN